ncbi:hypothetical protein PMZ80_010465 [Knufia obscura]|uniref:DOC domain-containing protein n=2 Tax=Knufia TaxID=430999 RepID=A0AAN8EBL6_9EURO|nr:hypothetical protein PMZ80_010465 [Knufia obscura]KAK5950185.1 hypothetical protein OHC33_008900 [Knufia fluminis]
MPRPARRAAPAQAREEQPATTPTRPTATNAITAAIPPSMLETPTGPRFQTTPQPAPRAHDLESSVPEAARPTRLRRQQRVELLDQVGRAPDTTPVNAGNVQNGADESHISHLPLGSADDDTINEEESSLLESVHHTEDVKALAGLRDISSLATWTLSSAKPGCALAQLRHPSPSHFWQSDGPQPHTLTLHFFKLVSIVKLRVYLDFKLDESYTPTKMKFFAGMSEGGLVEFGHWEVEESVDPETGEMSSNVEKIRGWIDISLKGVGGRDPSYYEAQEARRARTYEKRMQQRQDVGDSIMDLVEDEDEEDDLVGGDVLRAMVVQVRICENHQNGKDTHVRGFQVFAKDETSAKEMRKLVKRTKPRAKKGGAVADMDGEQIVSLQPAEWMGEPEIR